MRTMYRPIARLFVALQLLLLAGMPHAAPRVGDTPLVPAIRTLDGQMIGPAAWRGKFVVFSFFSSDCPFCMNEAPKLQKLYRDYGGEVAVVGVNVEYKDPEQRAKARKWVEKYGLTHPVTTDFEVLAAALGKPKGLPVNVVLDRSGKVVRIDVGEIFDEDFEDIGRMARRK